MALEEESGAPGFWAAPEQAQKKMSRLQALREPLEALRRAEGGLAELDALVELAGLAPGDPELAAEQRRLLPGSRALVSDLEAQVLLDGPYDRTDALLSIHPGAGGTESQDWAAMLLRMYRRWAEARGAPGGPPSGAADAASAPGAGTEAGAEAVFSRCAAGDATAQALVHAVASDLGRGLALVVNLLNPALVVLGGGVMESLHAHLPAVSEAMRARVIGEANRRIPVVRSAVGYDAALLGAAVLAGA